MTVLSQFYGGTKPPKSLVCGNTATQISHLAAATKLNLRATLSGALTANTLKSIYSVTGSGVLAVCAVRAKDATARTARIKIVVDGTTIYDLTSSSITANDVGMIAVGTPTLISTVNPDYGIIPIPLAFNASLDIQIASSLTETDKLELDYLAWGN